MAYILQNQLEISLFIDDNEYPLGDTNLLNSLHIATTLRVSMPMLSMSIDDVQHIFDKIGLQDAIPIRVVIKAANKDTKTYNFRYFDHARNQKGGYYTYMIYGYYDSPLYWNGTACTGIQGSSNAVLQEIATRCGLKYSGTTTNDVQLWMQQNVAYRSFVKDVTLHGYVNDTSCMVSGVDLDGTLIYRNVNALPEPTKKIVAYQYAKDAFTALEVQVSTDAGLNNALTGYQNMRYQQSSIADALHTQIKDLTFNPNARAPLLNNTMKQKTARGPVRFGPVDVGNAHEKRERANYQNIRYRNLFSFGLDAMLSQLTNFELAEQVVLSVQREDTGQDTPNSGTYTITGHSLYVQGGTYNERVGMARHGSNANYVDG